MATQRSCALGIVLSGGGARGIAHVGVLRALEERGLSPDCVAGTSAGAIVGALYAAGHSPERMVEFFETKNPFRLTKLAIGKPGILDSSKVVADFEEYFPENSFEALAKPLRVTATDLLSGSSVIFDSGPLIPAILASSAIPLVFTPIEIDGRCLADGGIADNFPAELLRERCQTLLGVYVSPLRGVERSDLHNSLSVLLRALDVGMFLHSQVKFDRCDALICPSELSRFGLFDTRHSREIEAVGYAAATERLEEIERARKGRKRRRP